MSFPRNSAFNQGQDPHVAARIDRDLRLYANARDFASSSREQLVAIDRLEDWVYRLDELANRFDVPDTHVVAGHAVSSVSEEIGRIRDELTAYLRG